MCCVLLQGMINVSQQKRQQKKKYYQKKVNEDRMSEDDFFVSRYLSQFPKVVLFSVVIFLEKPKSIASVYALFVLFEAFQANKRWFSERAWCQRRRIEMYSLGSMGWYTQTILTILGCVWKDLINRKYFFFRSRCSLCESSKRSRLVRNNYAYIRIWCLFVKVQNFYKKKQFKSVWCLNPSSKYYREGWEGRLEFGWDPPWKQII